MPFFFFKFVAYLFVLVMISFIVFIGERCEGLSTQQSGSLCPIKYIKGLLEGGRFLHKA
jgi:hypothetical protein